MLHNAKTLSGYTLKSRDGEIGKVREFYFDDRHWTIRYLVADTGVWLTDRQVLISPYALISVNKEDQHIGISLTRKQIENSPPVGSDKPVSRQFEAAYYGYYGWPMYWGGPYMWGASGYPYVMSEAEPGRPSAQGVNPYAQRLGASPSALSDPDASPDLARDDNASNPHLRSTHDVSGHHIQAADGEIGHVEDFVIDDETWAIRYLVVDTVNWWPGKRVLVAARWIERVSWEASKVFVNLSREAIKQAPEFTEEALLTRDYESRLHDHYSRPGYWVDEPIVDEQSRPKQIFKD